jgi:hypothetical protein
MAQSHVNTTSLPDMRSQPVCSHRQRSNTAFINTSAFWHASMPFDEVCVAFCILSIPWRQLPAAPHSHVCLIVLAATSPLVAIHTCRC